MMVTLNSGNYKIILVRVQYFPAEENAEMPDRQPEKTSWRLFAEKPSINLPPGNKKPGNRIRRLRTQSSNSSEVFLILYHRFPAIIRIGTVLRNAMAIMAYCP